MSDHDAEVERLRADLDRERQARLGLAATLKAVMEDRDREQRQHGSWFRRAAIAEGKVGLHQGRAEAAEAALGKERQAREWAEQQVERLRTALQTIPFAAYGEAQSEGCDPNGAWDCFLEAANEHIRAALTEAADGH